MPAGIVQHSIAPSYGEQPVLQTVTCSPPFFLWSLMKQSVSETWQFYLEDSWDVLLFTYNLQDQLALYS